MIKFTYHGHSCFTVESDGFKFVTDPFTNVPGYAELKLEANEVYCSHDHDDHCFVQAVKLTAKENPFKVTEIHSFHDHAEGTKRGPNCIRIFEKDGLRICHFGDIGCHPTDEQVEMLKNLDVALIPVGGYFTAHPTEIKALLDEIQPKVTIPMHYRKDGCGYDVIGTLDEFTKLVDGVVYAKSNTVEITGKEEKQILVLDF